MTGTRHYDLVTIEDAERKERLDDNQKREYGRCVHTRLLRCQALVETPEETSEEVIASAVLRQRAEFSDSPDRRQWTAREVGELLFMFRDGMSYEYMATALDRPVESVHTKVQDVRKWMKLREWRGKKAGVDSDKVGVVWQMKRNGYSFAEIARIVGCTAGAVRYLVSKGET